MKKIFVAIIILSLLAAFISCRKKSNPAAPQAPANTATITTTSTALNTATATPTNTQVIFCGPNSHLSGGVCVCNNNYYDCNGNPADGCENYGPCPSGTDTPGSSPTASATAEDTVTATPAITETLTVTSTDTITGTETEQLTSTVTVTQTITPTPTITPTSATPFMFTDVTNITSSTYNTNFVTAGYGPLNTVVYTAWINSSNVFTHITGPYGTAQILEILLYGGTDYNAQIVTVTTPEGTLDVYIPAVSACAGMGTGNYVIMYAGNDGTTYYRYSGLNCVDGTKIDYTFDQASSMPGQLARQAP